MGAAGLSLSLAGGASAGAGAAIADMPACSSVAVSQELTLAEEEIADVGLATFRIADKESTLQFRTRIAAGGCGAMDIRVVNLRTELPPFYRRLGYAEAGTEPVEEPRALQPFHFIVMSKVL